MKAKYIRLFLNIFAALCVILFAFLCYYAWKANLFSSTDALYNFIKPFGIAGPIVFISLQALQVIVPMLPCGISSLAGVVLFGPWYGFWYNYAGICLGSIIAFIIARRFGMPILSLIFSPKSIQKYQKHTGDGSHFTKFFIIAIVAPIFPDDFLCYLAGTTPMSFTKYAAIILLGKPFTIAAYSLGWGWLERFL